MDHFTVTLKGKAAHVSTPHLGVDTVYMAGQIIVGLQAIVTRLSSPVEPLLIGVGKVTAGDAYNIVADHAVLEGTVRAMTPQARKTTQERLNALCESVAGLYGGTASVEWEDFAPPLVNPADICEEANSLVTGLLGAQALVTDRALSLAGDDFARFQEELPGVYAYLGSADPGRPDTCRPLHNEKFDLDESVLPMGAALHAAYTLEYLTGKIG